jgi:Rho GDP-dissociation inhibitor
MAAASPAHILEQQSAQPSDELKDEIDIDEFPPPENYNAPAPKSVKEIIQADEHDESLRKYKEKLLSGHTDESIEIEPHNPLNVLVKRLCVVVDGEIKHAISLPAPHEFTMTIKEGSHYEFRFEFFIQREIVTGLKYLHKVSRLGIGVNREVLMLGSFAPRKEIYVLTSPPEEAPHGLLSRGKYRVRSLITDDDKHRWLEFVWNIEIAKDWGPI